MKRLKQNIMKVMGAGDYALTDTWACNRNKSNVSYGNPLPSEYLQAYDNDALIQQAIHIPIEQAFSTFVDFSDDTLDGHFLRLGVKDLMVKEGSEARLKGDLYIVPMIFYVSEAGNKLSINLDVPIEKILENEKYNDLSVEYLVTAKAQEDEQSEKEMDLTSPRALESKFLKIGDAEVHYSRAVRLRGSLSGESLIKSIWHYYTKFKTAYEELIIAVEESNVTILKSDLKEMQRLYEEIDMNDASGDIEDLVMRKLREFKQDLNTRGMRLIDINEQLERQQLTNIASIVTAVEQSVRLLSASVDMQPLQFAALDKGGIGGANKGELFNLLNSLEALRTRVGEPVVDYLSQTLGDIYSIKNQSYEWQELSVLKYKDLL